MNFSKVVFFLLASICVACEITPNSSKDFAAEEKQAQLEAATKTEIPPQLEELKKKQTELKQQKAQEEVKDGTELSQSTLKKQLALKTSQLEVFETYLKLQQQEATFSEKDKAQMEQKIENAKNEIQALKDKIK